MKKHGLFHFICICFIEFVSLFYFVSLNLLYFIICIKHKKCLHTGAFTNSCFILISLNIYAMLIQLLICHIYIYIYIYMYVYVYNEKVPIRIPLKYRIDKQYR